MKKASREPRKDLVKKVDLMKPITIDQLGTEDDPCFGKLYDITTSECQRCGDCELCSIVMGQKNHLAREKEHKKGSFKDLEEIPVVDKKEIQKKIRARVVELVKDAGKKGIPYDKVFDDVKGSYSKFGFSVKRLHSIIKGTIEKKQLTHKENVIKWNKK